MSFSPRSKFIVTHFIEGLRRMETGILLGSGKAAKKGGKMDFLKSIQITGQRTHLDNIRNSLFIVDLTKQDINV